MLFLFVISYFNFNIGYILRHLGLFGLTKWQPEVPKIYLSASLKSQTKQTDHNLPIFFAMQVSTNAICLWSRLQFR